MKETHTIIREKHGTVSRRHQNFIINTLYNLHTFCRKTLFLCQVPHTRIWVKHLKMNGLEPGCQLISFEICRLAYIWSARYNMDITWMIFRHSFYFQPSPKETQLRWNQPLAG